MKTKKNFILRIIILLVLMIAAILAIKAEFETDIVIAIGGVLCIVINLWMIYYIKSSTNRLRPPRRYIIRKLLNLTIVLSIFFLGLGPIIFMKIGMPWNMSLVIVYIISGIVGILLSIGIKEHIYYYVSKKECVVVSWNIGLFAISAVSDWYFLKYGESWILWIGLISFALAILFIFLGKMINQSVFYRRIF